MPKLTVHTQKSYHQDLFSLFVSVDKKKTFITMQTFIPFLTTKNIPQTYSVLEEFFPAVLKTYCVNGKNLPFRKEVKNTELGHLFEHILLEKLFRIKFSKYLIRSVYNGITEWDWNKNPGEFKIEIDTGHHDNTILPSALEESINIFNSVLFFAPSVPFRGPSYPFTQINLTLGN